MTLKRLDSIMKLDQKSKVKSAGGGAGGDGAGDGASSIPGSNTSSGSGYNKLPKPTDWDEMSRNQRRTGGGLSR